MEKGAAFPTQCANIAGCVKEKEIYNTGNTVTLKGLSNESNPCPYVVYAILKLYGGGGIPLYAPQ